MRDGLPWGRDYSSEDEEVYSYEENDDKEDPDERKERMKLERKRENALKKRNQREHMAHLKKEDEKKLRIILYFKQNLIPMCGFNGFFGDANCEWGVDDVFHCM